MKRVVKFLKLSPNDRHILVAGLFLVVLIRLGMFCIPFRILWRIINRKIGKHSGLQCAELVEESKIVWAIKTANRYIPRTTCLAQALAAQVLFSHYGHSTRLYIGVAKSEAGKLLAHAWVESRGEVVIGGLDDIPRYTPLPQLTA